MEYNEIFRRTKRIISEISGIPQEEILEELHLFEDLGVDSIDALDIFHELDAEFNIKIPLQLWLEEMYIDQDKSDHCYKISGLATESSL